MFKNNGKIIEKIVKYLKRSSFIHGVITISGSTVLGQLISLAVSPILTRLYTPEDVGVWGLFMSFIGVTSVVSTFCYEMAIVAVRREEEAISLIKGIFVIVIGMSLILSGVFVLLDYYELLGYGSFSWQFVLFIPATLVILQWGQTLRYWCIRRKEYGLVGKFVLTRAMARALAQNALFAFKSGGLILGEIVGLLSGLLMIWKVFPTVGHKWFSKNIFLKYKVYPLAIFPSTVLNTLALMAPVPVFSSIYGVKIGGALALAQRVVNIPVSMIGTAVADVFYGQVANLTRSNPTLVPRLLIVTALKLGVVATVFGAVLWYVAPKISILVFGPNWELAGNMMARMAPWMVGVLTVSPITRVVFLTKYPWVKLCYDIVACIIVTIPFWIEVKCSLNALMVISCLRAASYLFYFFLLVFLARNYLNLDSMSE